MIIPYHKAWEKMNINSELIRLTSVLETYGYRNRMKTGWSLQAPHLVQVLKRYAGWIHMCPERYEIMRN